MEGERGRPFVRAVRGRLRGARGRARFPLSPFLPFPFPAFSRLPAQRWAASRIMQFFIYFFLKGISLFCGLICLYFKLPNPCDHLEELFLVSLILDLIGVREALSPSRDRRCPPGFAAFFPLWD